MRRKKDQSGDLKNKAMNDATYKLRREAMQFIYEARNLVGKENFPRVTIRITENDRSILGQARLGDCIVWITERAIDSEKFDLRTIVFHELLHAVYGIGHFEDCPLMKPIHSPLTKEQCHELFLKYAGGRKC